jgi:hypothetical protein
MNIKLHNIFFVAKSEYVKWLFNPKFLLITMVILPLRELVVLPIMNAAAQMEQPLNFLEISIATLSSDAGMLLLVFCYMLLMISFPSVNGNTYFYLSRMGRRNWVLGELLFQIFSAVTYCLVIMALTIVQALSISYLDNGWSLVVTDYDAQFSQLGSFKMSSMIPANLYYQMSPAKAFLASLGLCILLLVLTSVVFTLGCLYGRRLLVFLLEAAVIVISSVLILTKSKAMWLFPFSHECLLLHYYKYFRKYIVPPALSVLYFVVLIIFFSVLTYRKARRVSLETIGG